jgi:hypothetical protein
VEGVVVIVVAAAGRVEADDLLLKIYLCSAKLSSLLTRQTS